MTKDQNPIRNFEQAVVKIHNDVPMNSPLDKDQVRSHYDLTVLMGDYIKEAFHENGRYDGMVSTSVLSDFIRWLAYSDK